MNDATTSDQPKQIFVAVPKSGIVMRGREFICRAVTHAFAKRIAKALNQYKNHSGE